MDISNTSQCLKFIFFSADRVHCRRQKIYLYKFVYFRAYPFSDPDSYSTVNPALYALIPRREYHNSHYHRQTQIGVDGTHTDYTDTAEVIPVYYDDFPQNSSLCGLWSKKQIIRKAWIRFHTYIPAEAKQTWFVAQLRADIWHFTRRLMNAVFWSECYGFSFVMFAMCCCISD